MRLFLNRLYAYCALFGKALSKYDYSARPNKYEKWQNRNVKLCVQWVRVLLGTVLMSVGVRGDEGDVEIYVLLGKNLRRLGLHGRAMSSFNGAVNSKEWKDILRLKRLNKLIELGTRDEAATIVKRISFDGLGLGSKLEAVNCLFMAELYESAYDLVDGVLEAEPNNMSFLYEKGRILVKMKKYDEALQVFGMVLKLSPERYDIYLNRADLFRYLARYDEALMELEGLRKLNPFFPGISETEEKNMSAKAGHIRIMVA